MEEFLNNITSKYRRADKRTKRNLMLSGYALILLVISVVVGVSYTAPVVDKSGANLDVQPILDDARTAVAPATNSYIDQVAEVELAYNVAAEATLSVENLVLEKSTTLAIQGQLSQTESTSISKPTVVTTDTNDAMIAYTTVEGDTVGSLANKFSITAQTIKWSNNLIDDTLGAGTSLVIPSVDGIVYTVKEGDDIGSVASKYKSDSGKILAINGIDDLVVGEKVVLPGGVLPETERPGYTAPVIQRSNTPSSYTAYGGYSGTSRFLYVNSNPTTPGNRHYYGNCTWFAWEYRLAIGRPLPAAPLGNGGSWRFSLSGYGYTVNQIPAVGAVQDSPGHVAVVIAVNGDSVTVREMNAMGYNVVSERTMSMSLARQYWYIH